MKEARMDVNFRKRLQKHLYYSDMANIDVPSLPLTELAVDYFNDSAPEKLGQVHLYTASNMIRRNHVSPCSVVLSMMYAKRLRQQKQRDKDLLQTMSSTDVFFISMMMASKYLYDEGVDEEVFNDEWADNTDQDVDDVNQMEMDFLQAMDWKLFVRPQEFEDTLANIERRLSLQEGLKRGWYTYTEMDVLMNSDLMRTLWNNVGSECSKLLTAISAAYLTGVLSMVGSAALAVQVSGQLSSLTVALLTLQSPSLMSSVTSRPLPQDSSLLSLGLVQMPSMLNYSGGFDNSSDQEGPDSMTSENPESVVWYKGASAQADHSIDELNPLHETDKNSEDNRRWHGETIYVNPDVGSQVGNNTSDEPTQCSSWSLWFFDSLISQLWAITFTTTLLPFRTASDKFPGFSSLPAEQNNSGDDNEEVGYANYHLHGFCRRQKSLKVNKESSVSRPTEYPQGCCNLDESLTYDHIRCCWFYDVFGAIGTLSHFHQSPTRHCSGRSCSRQDSNNHKPSSHNRLPPSDLCTDCIRDPTICDYCVGTKCCFVKNEPIKRSLVKLLADDPQLPAQIVTSMGLLRTPIGFSTSDYQALLAT